ncbi:MAG TPA: OmpA family protein [Thermodesulfobacteriota bacterium]|nr:OmpA family protein [Thermodesulfobacteriota bacterium]
MYKHFAAPLILALFLALPGVSLPGLPASAPEAFAQTAPGKADVFFKLNEFAFGPGGEAALKEIAETLKNNPGTVLVIEGYSDVTGDDEYNLNLSRRRAEAVRRFYVAEGVDPARITVGGKGKTDRFASGSDESSLRLNRRVTIRLESGTAPESAPAPEAPARAPGAATAPESETSPKEMIDAITIEETEPAPGPAPVPAPESAPETPSGPGVVSPAVSEMLGKSMRRLTAGRIVFDTPGEMSVGESYTIEAAVTHRFLKDLSQSLAESGADGSLRLGDNVTLHLKGSGFDITPVSDSSIGAEQEFPIDDTEDAKTIAEDSTASWEWSVKPEKSGFQTLLLSVEVAVEDEHLREILAESPVFEKVVQVKPSFFHSISKSYLLMAVIIVIAVAAVGWALIKKLRLG